MTWRPLPGDGRDRDPRPVGESLDRLTRSFGGPSAAALSVIFAAWADVVGPGIAEHARPLSLRGTTLVVGVADPMWRTQLTYLGADLQRRLAEVVGAGVVERIDVRVRPAKEA